MTKNKVIAKIMEDLVQKAMHERCFSSRNAGSPGEMIERLGPVKRQLLKELTSEDMDDVRPDSFYNI